jgi:4-hydroxybenzoyl-CoA thioesterase
MAAYELSVKVRFGDVDAAGIAYFPSIFNMIHGVFEDLWEFHVGVPYADLITGQRLGFPLVNSNVDFKSPLRFGDCPRVVVTLDKLGRSSLALRYRFYQGQELALDAHMTTACIDMDHLKSCAIPDEYRGALLSLSEESEQ